MGIVRDGPRVVGRVDSISPAAVLKASGEFWCCRVTAKGAGSWSLRNDCGTALGTNAQLAQLTLDLPHLTNRFNVNVLSIAEKLDGFIHLITGQSPCWAAAPNCLQFFES